MRRYACGWESQRDSAPKPRVARNELPWERFGTGHNPNGVASRSPQSVHPSQSVVCPGTWSTHSRIGRNPVGVEMLGILSPRVARSDLATLGFEAKSLWDFFTEMSKLQAQASSPASSRGVPPRGASNGETPSVLAAETADSLLPTGRSFLQCSR